MDLVGTVVMMNMVEIVDNIAMVDSKVKNICWKKWTKSSDKIDIKCQISALIVLTFEF